MLLSVLMPKCCVSKAKRLDFGVKENDVTSLEQACAKPVRILYVQIHQRKLTTISCIHKTLTKPTTPNYWAKKFATLGHLLFSAFKLDQWSYMIFPHIAVLFKQKWIYLNQGLYQEGLKNRMKTTQPNQKQPQSRGTLENGFVIHFVRCSAILFDLTCWVSSLLKTVQ